MLAVKKPKRVVGSPGIVWPGTGTDTPDVISSVFGPRPFLPHVVTVNPPGESYDFHRGDDIDKARGAPVYSPQHGVLTRVIRTHFGWETDGQLTWWTETDAASGCVFTRQAPSSLRMTVSRVGAQTFPNCARFEPNDEWFNPTSSPIRCGMRVQFTSDPVLVGGVFGMGAWDPATGQYYAIEYDGTTLTARGAGNAGAFAESGTTVVATPTYLDIYYTPGDDTLRWRYSDNESAGFTNIATKTGVAALLTNKARQCWKPVLYWRSTDAAAGTQVIDLERFGWADLQTVFKFGNWAQVHNQGKFSVLHFQELLDTLRVGDIVESGQLLGYVGDTGYDETAGPNLEPHIHIEWDPDGEFLYDDYQGQNPLRAGVLPRTNVSNNVSAVIADEADPQGTASHKLTITVQRANQDFDVNEIRLTGSTTSRTVNFDTSVGIDPVNWRKPIYDGVHIMAPAFDQSSTQQVLVFYFAKATVGASVVSAYVKDCNGVTLWSTP